MYTRPNDNASFASLLRLARHENMEARPAAVDKIKILLKNGIDPNKCEDEIFTPLGLALCHDEIINVNVVKLLLENGANPNLSYNSGITKDHVVATLVDNYFDEYFNCYMSNERVEQKKIYYKERNNTILESIKLLIDHGIDLHCGVASGIFTVKTKEISVMDYVKQLIDKNKEDESEHSKIEQLNKVLDYYAEKEQNAVIKIKM